MPTAPHHRSSGNQKAPHPPALRPPSSTPPPLSGQRASPPPHPAPTERRGTKAAQPPAERGVARAGGPVAGRRCVRPRALRWLRETALRPAAIRDGARGQAAKGSGRTGVGGRGGRQAGTHAGPANMTNPPSPTLVPLLATALQHNCSPSRLASYVLSTSPAPSTPPTLSNHNSRPPSLS
jgi:hypothetical protein